MAQDIGFTANQELVPDAEIKPGIQDMVQPTEIYQSIDIGRYEY
jgi:hypothetical protein